jgi:Peptidase M15
MTRFLTQTVAALIAVIAISIAVIVIAACGSSAGSSASLPSGRPQAVEPSAGVQAVVADPAAVVVGDTSATARSLNQVEAELTALNLCGGVPNGGNGQPLVQSNGPGFVADPGTQQTEGQLPVITADLNALAHALGVTIYGISGYRSPARSVAVGGHAIDPHTKGEAEDIGVDSLLRSSAARISEVELAKFGLYRPFDPSDNPDNTEVNHVQLLPSNGRPVPIPQASAAWDLDPAC